MTPGGAEHVSHEPPGPPGGGAHGTDDHRGGSRGVYGNAVAPEVKGPGSEDSVRHQGRNSHRPWKMSSHSGSLRGVGGGEGMRRGTWRGSVSVHVQDATDHGCCYSSEAIASRQGAHPTRHRSHRPIRCADTTPWAPTCQPRCEVSVSVPTLQKKRDLQLAEGR